LVFSILAAALIEAANAPAQTTAGWRTYDSPLYSFPYPPTWTIQQQSQHGILSLNPLNGDPPAMEIGYASDFRGDIDTFLDAERDGIKALAQQYSATVQFREVEAGPRGGRQVSGEISKPGYLSLIATSLAIGIGRSVYVVRMLSTPRLNYEHMENYRLPMLNGFVFKVPNSAISGGWQTRIEQTSVDGRSAPRRIFDVSLSFRDDGSYLYAATQSDTPRWQLEVTGTYAIGPPTQNLSETVLAVSTAPRSVRFTPQDGGVNQDSELSRLYFEGFPRIVAEVLALQSQRQGNLWLRRSNPDGRQVILFPGPAAVSILVQVVNGATFATGPVAPGSLVTLFGSFPADRASYSSLPLPVTLGGATVSIGGRSAPLLFAGPKQINAQVPFELDDGPAPIIVIIGSTRLTGTASVARTAPVIFVENGHATGNQDYSRNSQSNPARAGSVISVYVTGQGAFLPQLSTGVAAPQNPLAYTAATTTATVAGRAAEVLYSGGAPGFAGLAQVNIRIPAGLSRGDHPLVISVGNVLSNSAGISVVP
jgi:uncharacterized protein (TIGR03437 family)